MSKSLYTSTNNFYAIFIMMIAYFWYWHSEHSVKNSSKYLFLNQTNRSLRSFFLSFFKIYDFLNDTFPEDDLFCLLVFKSALKLKKFISNDDP